MKTILILPALLLCGCDAHNQGPPRSAEKPDPPPAATSVGFKSETPFEIYEIEAGGNRYVVVRERSRTYGGDYVSMLSICPVPPPSPTKGTP